MDLWIQNLSPTGFPWKSNRTANRCPLEIRAGVVLGGCIHSNDPKPEIKNEKEGLQMKCPIDGTLLQTNNRVGVEINQCPQCRGVWLDRGELEKIAKNSGASAPALPEGDYDEDGYHPTSSTKVRSFFSELFDF